MTNYIMCLAHFCEVHGPLIVCCTQQFPSSSYKTQLLDPTATTKSRQQTCALCQLVLPDDAANVTLLLGKTMVVLGQYPASQKRYMAVSKLALKALLYETTSDITKPMYYGDLGLGYCVFKIFKIRDASARGGERKYAMMIVANEEKEMLMQWNLISLYFNQVIELVQHRSQPEPEIKPTNMLDHERYLRRSITRPKSITEMTRDPQIFVKLHLCAVDLLRDIMVP